ncbi:MAG: HAD-IA family hydrolase [Candidatus Neomarinimicrobiota bacterium]
MKKTDLIIYDFDGTICNTLPDIVKSMNTVLLNNGLDEIPSHKVRSFIGGGISKLVKRSVLCAIPSAGKNEEISEELLEKILKEMSDYYSEHLMDHSFLYKDSIEVLEYFKEIPQLIVSNKPVKMIEAMLEEFNAKHYFDLIVGGDTLDVCKPHPAVWDYVKESLNLSDKLNGFMVGDSVPDLAFAKVAQLKAVAVSYGYNDLDVLQKEGADHFIDALSELKNIISR